MREQSLKRPSAWLLFLRSFFFATLAITICCGSALLLVQSDRRQRQWHDDPRVTAAWVAGVTYGPKHTLTRGNPLLDWLNGHGITVLGRSDTLTGRFNGEPQGVEIWFATRSHLSGRPDLECHRVGRTAFSDDLGQPYHGFLDFQGDLVGVYLPSYDHAAQTLDCTLHWMSRQPGVAGPISAPMRFHFNLPHVARLLPPAAQVARGPVIRTQQGITVTLSRVRLSPPNYAASRYANYSAAQRTLFFHLAVQGGTLAASNVASLPTDRPLFGAILPSHPLFAWNAAAKSADPLGITDPYGIELLAPHEEITPMLEENAPRLVHQGEDLIYQAPVNGAGRGTDLIHVRFHVQPTKRGAQPVAFDLLARVLSEDEI